MSFISFGFLLFFPVVVFVYFLIPQRFRIYWLLAASYFFLMRANPKYLLLLAADTAVTWAGGWAVARAARKGGPAAPRRKKAAAALSLTVAFGILFVFKYLNFFCGLFARALSFFGTSIAAAHFDLLLPIGISFYTFQSVTYVVDVYRGDAKPEKNFCKYALFVSFFPQLLSGPIEEARNMLPQFNEVHRFDYDRARHGLLLMLWGYFQKMVVADRLGTLVAAVYDNPDKHFGLDVLVATVFFAFQIYCDFGGYSNIALGAAEVMGFRLTRNFERPYFSKSIPEFWRRWHISLGRWFRDYLYIPLGGNRCSKPRHYFNLLVVFMVCGLWHGAALSFIIWGALHGLYQVVGLLLKPAKRRAEHALGLREESLPVRFYRAFATFVLVDFAWIFFRAKTFHGALTLIRNLFRFDPAAFVNGSLLNLGLNAPELWAALAGIAAVLGIDLLGRNRDLRAALLSRGTACRWAVYLSAALVVLIFGTYGPLRGAGQFIYSQF